MAGGTGRTLLSLSSSTFLSRTLFSSLNPRATPRVSLGFIYRRTLCLAAIASPPATEVSPPPSRHALLLDRLRLRHLKDSVSTTNIQNVDAEAKRKKKGKEGEKSVKIPSTFEELGLEKELMEALEEMRIEKPTEIQCMGIPAVLQGQSIAMGSHTGSGKTLAYMLPLVQLMRRDEALSGVLMKPRRPRAVVLCPTRELSEQVYRVSKSISHHARFRSTMVSGGVRLRPQEDSLNAPVDMVVGTPGRILQHIKDGNIVYGDIKYVVLDEADTMFDQGFGPDIRKFLAPLRTRASKYGDKGFQTVLVTATMTEAVQKLIDEEFQGIVHLRTSTFQKKVASARHDFIKVAGSENKLEALLQVLEPSLSKGNRVMVFCNTLNSSRAVDHYLSENQISTVNYHGEVPADERVENLKKFKSEDGDCPTLVCTDLAARGLDLDVDHVIMFDFPLNSIDYLHRTGRTARMGAKGKITSLVAKKDVPLATRIEDAIKKNESLEALNVNTVRKAAPASPSTRKITTRGRNPKLTKVNTTIQKGKSATGTRTMAKNPNKVVIKKFNKASPKFTKGDSKYASPRTPKDSKYASPRPLKDSKYASSRPLKDSKYASSRPPKDSKYASSRPPKDSKYASSRPPKDSKSTNGRPPKDDKYASLRPPKDSKFRTTFESRKADGGGKRSGAKLSVVGFRGRSSSGRRSQSGY
ncbi:DEAD-box ATP-dependent RNA helicase 39 isoform X2 [Carex littledalei]|uniref:DEAD-box ATP-dependent RNA helicase 39 isoform X2 n=1 Tax=Carex littledalei TaxID=544730 RepID=A0A833QQ70_9POAL|nr:DEAD-box ATP-dependent RNA helicase 39 isoform X2 [Carex littledalei]